MPNKDPDPGEPFEGNEWSTSFTEELMNKCPMNARQCLIILK
jgi:hypothetical protein